MQTFFNFAAASGNKKTGAIPVTTSGKRTCPPSCPFMDNGCYADSFPLKIHWKKLDDQGLTFDDLIDKIKDLPTGTFWRHNQAGDLAGDGLKICGDSLKKLVRANKRKRGFTYTHKPLTKENKGLIKYANQNGFTVNLSANNQNDVDRYMSLNIAPVVAVLPANTKSKVTLTKAGNKIVTCPAVTGDKMTCSRCQLCQKSDRNYAIGFPAHGNQKKKADQIASI